MAEIVKQEPSDNKVVSRILWWVRECTAFGLWLFILIKVLVIDVDILFVGILPPQANTFLKYKFFVLESETFLGRRWPSRRRFFFGLSSLKG